MLPIIKVDGECKCEIVENLACDYSDFESDHRGRGFIPVLSCEELKEKLINATFCKMDQILPKARKGAQVKIVEFQRWWVLISKIFINTLEGTHCIFKQIIVVSFE